MGGRRTHEQAALAARRLHRRGDVAPNSVLHVSYPIHTARATVDILRRRGVGPEVVPGEGKPGPVTDPAMTELLTASAAAISASTSSSDAQIVSDPDRAVGRDGAAETPPRRG